MNDYHSSANDAFSPQQERDRSGSMSFGNLPVSPPGPPSDHGGAAVDDAVSKDQKLDSDITSPTQASGPSGANSEQPKQVQEVLSSEIGIHTLLNRLKQSIASAKEFALFLKKRSSLEEDHANGIRKLTRTTQDVMRRPDHRQGTFGSAYEAMASTHERMAENGIEFSKELHQMHDELMELAGVAERSRKSWKQNGLSAENKVAEMEQTMRKSKTKYDSLADDYERVKTGESRQSGKMFGLKGHKSAQQHEGELLKKVQAADSVYHGHVQSLQAEKAQLVSTTRPEAIRALQDSIKEIDAGISLQMQKFASFNERLLLSNGLSVSPIQGPGGQSSSSQRSLRQAASSIDNEKDLNDYVTAQHRSVPPNTGEIKYERNPALNPPGSSSQQVPGGPVQQPAAVIQSPVSQTPPQGGFSGPQPLGPGSRTSTLGLGPITGVTGGDSSFPPSDDPRPFSQPHNRSFSQGNMPIQQGGPGQQFSARGPNQQTQAPGQRYGNGGSVSSTGPPQLGALPFQPSGSPPQQSGPHQPPHERTGSGVNSGQGAPGAGRSPPPYGMSSQPLPGAGPPPGSGPVPGPGASGPSKPMFGLPLNRLYERDGLAVPMVVYQCIQAVDMYGLNVEGIYRQSGSMTHIQKLKNMFDTESSNPALDFRNPENFYHDVNSVTGLLKQFFRDLPDPLLTLEYHDSFIAAAKQDDDTLRRDSLHAIINSLPDPNYATLRALTLHLWRVMDSCHVNRMNCHNLAVIFGPTLMGTDPSTAIADAGWQIKAIDTILQNTLQIFDED
ncbi:GTPase-activating beta-chimerin [Fusarium heterosporum]|uniref:GTPase-activating beta-chimerin n=1 Tax=Fusarium heterosporum TaxID=42747 RepID=A0A8H5WIT8_FUSHE|nr:GTPase-activating beta-chimerin [Fusarium heterosporum]